MTTYVVDASDPNSVNDFTSLRNIMTVTQSEPTGEEPRLTFSASNNVTTSEYTIPARTRTKISLKGKFAMQGTANRIEIFCTSNSSAGLNGFVFRVADGTKADNGVALGTTSRGGFTAASAVIPVADTGVNFFLPWLLILEVDVRFNSGTGNTEAEGRARYWQEGDAEPTGWLLQGTVGNVTPSDTTLGILTSSIDPIDLYEYVLTVDPVATPANPAVKNIQDNTSNVTWESG